MYRIIGQQLEIIRYSFYTKLNIEPLPISENCKRKIKNTYSLAINGMNILYNYNITRAKSIYNGSFSVLLTVYFEFNYFKLLYEVVILNYKVSLLEIYKINSEINIRFTISLKCNYLPFKISMSFYLMIYFGCLFYVGNRFLFCCKMLNILGTK